MNRKQLRDAIKTLDTMGLLEYGSVIQTKTLETLFNIDFQVHGETWAWLSPLLGLKQELLDMGYFVSERGMDEGNIRLLEANEIPEHLHKRRLKRYSKMSSDLSCAQRLPKYLLGETNRKVLHHEQDRLSRDISKLCEQNPEIREQFCLT